jgi:hypothetical protein
MRLGRFAAGYGASSLLVMVHDFVRQGRVRSFYVAGLVLFLLTGPAVRTVARGSDAWRTISGWLVPWVS